MRRPFLHSLFIGCCRRAGGFGRSAVIQTAVFLSSRLSGLCAVATGIDAKRAVSPCGLDTAPGYLYSIDRIISWRSPVCSKACWLFCSWFCRELACHSSHSVCNRAFCSLCCREPVCSSWHSTGIFSGSWLCTLCRCSWYTCRLGNFLYTLCICNRCICTLFYCTPFCSIRFSLCCRWCFEPQPA